VTQLHVNGNRQQTMSPTNNRMRYKTRKQCFTHTRVYILVYNCVQHVHSMHTHTVLPSWLSWWQFSLKHTTHILTTVTRSFSLQT